MKDLTDLEIVKLCAEAMGYTGFKEYKGKLAVDGGYYDGKLTYYQPLHDDAQAMALVKKFPERVLAHLVLYVGNAFSPVPPEINRAICECVARMQLSLAVEKEHSMGKIDRERDHLDPVDDHGQ